MTKADAIRRVAREARTSKAQASRAVAALIDAVTRALKKGESVTFVGFGTFKVTMRKARMARNPLTGAPVKIKRRRVVRFAAGKALKDTIR